MRSIKDILHFRSDISPFLTHLTREREEITPNESLHSILEQESLIVGAEAISAAQYILSHGERKNLGEENTRKYFGAVSFTETPVDQIHCLIEIKNRKVKLSPYGLVFVKDEIKDKGVSPVMYFNNVDGEADQEIRALVKGLVRTSEEVAAKILPLISFFGKFLTSPDRPSANKKMDFSWEREWRYPASEGPFEFEEEDIFIGLCPHDEIDEFESECDEIGFIDPKRPIEWYAPKLIDARKRLNLKYSVV